MKEDSDIPHRFKLAPLICLVNRKRIETFFQRDYARKEVSDPVVHSDGLLQVYSSKGKLEWRVFNEPRDWRRGQGCPPERL